MLSMRVKPSTAPAPSSDRGIPMYADQTIEHRQLSGLRNRAKPRYSDEKWLSANGSRLMPISNKWRDRHTRSKFALNAHFCTLSSVSASIIADGITSLDVRSTTRTSSPSTE